MEMAYSWIIYSCLIFGSGIFCARRHERLQAASSCSVNNQDKFHCSNGMCIDWWSVCDGYMDCSDGSDETKDMCALYDYGTNTTMDCGRVRIKNQVISENGYKKAMVETAPWYVGIYKLINSNYHWKCGGSIIAPNVVISAAHCFWEEGMLSKTISINDALYKIAVGKYDRNLTIVADNEFTKIMNVDIIYLNEGYMGGNSEDIAVIVLANKIPFSNGLAAPVCVDWKSQYNVVNGDQGKVVVWNTKELNTEQKYDLLLEKEFSYINTITCQKLIAPLFRKYVTIDTFCASSKSEKGDSDVFIEGSDISFLHSNSYFLTGVNIPFFHLVNSTVITGFTDIKYYVNWIRGILNKHVTVNSCVLPTVEGVEYSYQGSDDILPHGTLTDYNRIVIENCELGYHKAYLNSRRLCLGKGKWLSTSDKSCFKMCPPLESTSLDIKCSYNGKYADCSNSSIPDTIAIPSCKSTYTAPNGQQDTPLELHCQKNGSWSNQLYRCYPNCVKVDNNRNNGLISYDVKPFLGSAMAPWNVGVYQFNKKKSNYDLKCGGSIIAPKLVVSAAHCFWEEGMLSNTISINDDLYKIAVGKYDRNFTTIDNEFTKIFNVDVIHLNEAYVGSIGSYFEDIAVLVLKNSISFSYGVAPICLDWMGKYNLVNGDQGKIFSWGRTENGNRSPVLLEASLSYINNSFCQKMFKNRFASYLTVDKFCAGSASGQGVSVGESGAGLTFLHSDLYYLTGIVSVNDPHYNITVFTEIKFHIHWIRRLFGMYN